MDGVSLSKESCRFVEKEKITFYVISKESANAAIFLKQEARNFTLIKKVLVAALLVRLLVLYNINKG